MWHTEFWNAHYIVFNVQLIFPVYTLASLMHEGIAEGNTVNDKEKITPVTVCMVSFFYLVSCIF